MMPKLSRKSLSRHFEENGDRYLLLFVCCYLVFQAFNQFLHYTHLRGMVWIVFSRGFLAVLALLAGIVVLKRKPITALAFEGAFAVLLLCTYFWGSPYPDFKSFSFNLLVIYIPMGLSFYCVESDTRILDYLYFSSWIIEIICIVTAFLAMSAGYSSTMSACLLVPILVKLDRFNVSRKWYDLLMVLLDLMAIFLGGSRGPFLCVAVFLLIMLISNDRLSVRKRISIIALLIVLAALLYAVYPSLVALGEPLIERFDIQSRTLKLLLSGAIGYDSGHIPLWRYFLGKIRESPLIGYGVTGSWDFVSSSSNHSYPHNIVLELLMAFGIPIGTLLTLLIGAIAVRGLTQKNPKKRRIASIFVANLAHLLWSGSLFTTPLFFVGMASCLRPERKGEGEAAAPQQEE